MTENHRQSFDRMINRKTNPWNCQTIICRTFCRRSWPTYLNRQSLSCFSQAKITSFPLFAVVYPVFVRCQGHPLSSLYFVTGWGLAFLFIFKMIGNTRWYCALFITGGWNFNQKRYPRCPFLKTEEMKGSLVNIQMTADRLSS